MNLTGLNKITTESYILTCGVEAQCRIEITNKYAVKYLEAKKIGELNAKRHSVSLRIVDVKAASDYKPITCEVHLNINRIRQTETKPTQVIIGTWLLAQHPVLISIKGGVYD